MQYTPGRKSSLGRVVRRHVGQLSRGRGMGAGSALGIRFNNWWKPPKGVVADFRLLPGSYLNIDGIEADFFMYVEHWVNRSHRSFVCSKEWKIENGELMAVGGKCLGCEERDRGADDIGTSLRHAFNGIHLAHYHLEQVLDNNNRPMTKERDGKEVPVLRKVLCEGRRCPHCRDGLEKVFGKKVHWSIGSGHMEHLGGVLNDIEKDCANCDNRRSLYLATLECSKCANIVVDMENTDLKDEEIAKLADTIHTCRECGNKDELLWQLECENCQDPTPLSVFDCDLEIKRTGEDTNSTIQVPHWTPRDLTKELLELAKPWPFNKIFRGDPFEIQAKILKIRNPYAEEADDHSRGYDDKASDDDPDYDE